MDLRPYQAAREHAAFIADPDRGLIVAVGADRASYLQGLLTNDIEALAPGSGCYAAYLTAQGRMISDMHVLELGDSILIDAPAVTRAELLARFDQFLFSEDVQLGDATDSFSVVNVIGPASEAIVSKALSTSPGAPGADALSSWPEYQNARFEFQEDRLILVRRDDAGLQAFTVYVPVPVSGAFQTALADAGAVQAPRDVAETLRIEAGRPLFGVDMDSETIPLEAGIEDRAISFTKGCYVGQEVIIRVLHRGHGRVARKLVGLLVDGQVPPRGASIFSGDDTIGQVTSATRSELLGSAIALGYVRRDFMAPGTVLRVGSDGTTADAKVVELPFVPR